MHNNVSKQHFKAIVTAASLPNELRLYDLHYTCATLLLVSGVSHKVVAERLGPASVVQTLDTCSQCKRMPRENARKCSLKVQKYNLLRKYCTEQQRAASMAALTCCI